VHIVTADLPNKPQQVIERDISMFQLASTKLPKLKDLPEQITAYKVTIGYFEGAQAHIAIYQKGGAIKKEVKIVTILNDLTGKFQNDTQFIFYGNEAVRQSSMWQSQTVMGVNFVVHIHDDFFVYSTNLEQHILKR